MAVYHFIHPDGRVFVINGRKAAEAVRDEMRGLLQRQGEAPVPMPILPGRPPGPPVEDPQAPPTPWHDLEDVRTWCCIGPDGQFMWMADETLIRAGIVTARELAAWRDTQK